MKTILDCGQLGDICADIDYDFAPGQEAVIGDSPDIPGGDGTADHIRIIGVKLHGLTLSPEGDEAVLEALNEDEELLRKCVNHARRAS